jgi:hypothetical protein
MYCTSKFILRFWDEGHLYGHRVFNHCCDGINCYYYALHPIVANTELCISLTDIASGTQLPRIWHLGDTPLFRVFSFSSIAHHHGVSCYDTWRTRSWQKRYYDTTDQSSFCGRVWYAHEHEQRKLNFLRLTDPTIEDSYRKQVMHRDVWYMLDLFDVANVEEFSG